MVKPCKKTNGNCTVAVDPDDSLPVQCVHGWAEHKHYYLTRFFDASRHVRTKFNVGTPKQREFGRGPGGTAFVDLFSGPGRARVSDSRQFIDGSPLLACKLEGPGAFGRIVLCDIDDENVATLKDRTARFGEHVHVHHGDCNRDIDLIAKMLPTNGYTVVLVDPFGPSALHFNTIRRLSQFARLDFIIHWPVGSMKRVFRAHETFEKVLGIPRGDWGVDIVHGSDIAQLLPLYRKQLATLGYPVRTAPVTSPAITNTRNLVLYRLVFASKDQLGDEIWNSITKKPPSGQMSLAL
jgi:three-Cys-motif partner protein